MRRISQIASALAIGLAGLSASSGQAQIRVQLNGEQVRFAGTQPRSVDGRVMVPLRGVLEKMGATVDWLAGSRTVIATKGDMELELPIGSRTAKVNERTVRLDVPAMTIAGSTMVPLRFVSEALGADVAWSSRNQTVMIDTDTRIASRDREFYRDRDTNPDRRFSRMVSVPIGTVIPARLDDPLSSGDNRVGDKFTVTVEPGRDDAGLPSGTRIEGVVREVVAASGGKPGVLDVDFRRVVLPDGTQKNIEGRVVSLDGKDLTRDSSGRLVAKGGRRGDERMKWVGIGAGAGLLIGTLTKGNVLVDALLGAGAGYLYNELQRKGAGNVNLKAGTEIGVKLDRKLQFAAMNE